MWRIVVTGGSFWNGRLEIDLSCDLGEVGLELKWIIEILDMLDVDEMCLEWFVPSRRAFRCLSLLPPCFDVPSFVSNIFEAVLNIIPQSPIKSNANSTSQTFSLMHGIPSLPTPTNDDTTKILQSHRGVTQIPFPLH
jgi:hypothetical protein